MASPALRSWVRGLEEPFRAAAARLLGWDEAMEIQARLAARGLQGPEFCAGALGELGVSWRLEGLHLLAAVKGPCLVAANHPFGGRDALLMNVLLGRARRDYRILANRILAPLAEVRDRLILVDAGGGERARERNRAALREALAWLRGGGLLGVFPSGEVSYWQAQEGRIADPAWAPQAARLALLGNATVVPLHFSGVTGFWLQVLARLHPSLKTPFLLREMLHGPCRRIEARLGRPIPRRRLPALEPPALAEWLRERCYDLAPVRHPEPAPGLPSSLFAG